jgi:hypothetical protein
MTWKEGKNVLHGLENDGIATHTKVVVGTPHFHFILGVTSVGNRELGCEPVDVVKVAVRGVLVLLVELAHVELVVVELVLGFGHLGCRGSRSSSGLGGGGSGMEGTPGSGSLLGLGGLFGRTELGGDLCGVAGRARVWALVEIGLGRLVEADALLLVDAVDLGVRNARARVRAGDARIAGRELGGSEGDDRAHDRALRRLDREPGHGRVPRRRGRRQRAQRARLGPAQVRAHLVEAAERHRREPVHRDEDEAWGKARRPAESGSIYPRSNAWPPIGSEPSDLPASPLEIPAHSGSKVSRRDRLTYCNQDNRNTSA